MNDNELRVARYKSDSEMQRILDEAIVLLNELGWKYERQPNCLLVWTPDNTGKYDSFHFEVTQTGSTSFSIHQWNSLSSKLRGSMRDIKGTTRDRVFGFIRNVQEYNLRVIQFKEVVDLLKTKRIKYYYMHDEGFEIRYRQYGIEHYLRFKLQYHTNVNAVLEIINALPNGTPSKEPDMFSSLEYREWR